MLIATAALCYALGTAIGWHMKKSLLSKKKNLEETKPKER